MVKKYIRQNKVFYYLIFDDIRKKVDQIQKY